MTSCRRLDSRPSFPAGSEMRFTASTRLFKPLLLARCGLRTINSSKKATGYQSAICGLLFFLKKFSHFLLRPVGSSLVGRRMAKQQRPPIFRLPAWIPSSSPAPRWRLRLLHHFAGLQTAAPCRCIEIKTWAGCWRRCTCRWTNADCDSETINELPGSLGN